MSIVTNVIIVIPILLIVGAVPPLHFIAAAKDTVWLAWLLIATDTVCPHPTGAVFKALIVVSSVVVILKKLPLAKLTVVALLADDGVNTFPLTLLEKLCAWVQVISWSVIDPVLNGA